MRDGVPNPGRREMIQRLTMSIGGMVTFPLVASAHPIQHHLRDASAVGLADSKAHVPEYAPEFLNARQFEMVRMLAERIVPGSTEARSGEFIDQLLTVAAVDDQQSFVRALTAFDDLAVARVGEPWVRLSERQQNDLLTLASMERPGVSIRDRFEHLKGWIVGAYYSSERGMRELGWTGRVFFPAFPGCDHADGHQ